jgi:Hemerythrin HHE cation binding domain
MESHDIRMLQQYSSLEYILLGDLRDLLEEPIDDENRKWLLAVLDALIDTLPREFDLENEDGYMSEVLERFPNWSHQVEQLHRDHERMFEKLKELRGRTERDSWIAPIANEVRHDVRDWIRILVAHNRRETRLVQMAMNLEVGVGD